LRRQLTTITAYLGLAALTVVLAVTMQQALDILAVRLAGDGASIRRWLSEGDWRVSTFGYLLQRKTGFNLAVFAVTVSVIHGIRYLRLYRAGEVDAALLARQLTESRLAALRQRLQPHFLSNTLNGIAELIREDAGRAEQMVEHLGDLLRAALDADERRLIPLSEECELARSYVELQQLRFEALRVSFDVDPEVAGVLVPPQLLQPAIENAVRFAMQSAMPHVAVRAAAQGPHVVLEVEDSGPGPGATGTVDGTGLSATRARVHAAYGAPFPMALLRGTSGGGLLRFNLPRAALDGADIGGAAHGRHSGG
jgi:LytS/YehU family sensor histidine kinase